MGNDPIFLTNLNLAYVVGRTDRSPCQRTQRWNTSKVCLLAVLITTLSWVVQEKTSWARSRAQLQALIFYGPSWGQGVGLDHQEKCARKHNRGLCLIRFVDRIWHLFKPPEATKLTAFEAPHARLGIGCVRGCYLKQNLSRKGPKKKTKCDYFFGLFFEASPKPLLWVCGVKMGSWKIPKIDLLGTPPTLLKCSK